MVRKLKYLTAHAVSFSDQARVLALLLGGGSIYPITRVELMEAVIRTTAIV